MAQKKKGSFRHRIKTANITMVSLIFLFLLIFNVVNYNMKEKYNSAFENYNELSSFYKNIEEADASLKDYLYTENPASLDMFDTLMTHALQSTEKLKRSPELQDTWRFDLLNRMTTEFKNHCESTVQSFIEDDREYLNKYNELQRIQYLIDNTASSYYTMITESMSAQKVLLDRTYLITTTGTILLIIILIAWLIYYSYQIITSITQPVDKLLQNINRIKSGEYDITQIAGCGEEMEKLCTALSDMANQIQINIEHEKEKAQLERQLLKWENENLKKDELLAQSELKMLQNQINPHFLFNTLNMIHRLSILGRNEDAADMIVKTSKLLRYGLDRQNSLSDLAAEIDCIRNYIEIQKKRFDERMNFELEVDEEAYYQQVAIPSMVLQPLVENAIKHGLSEMNEGGEISIAFYHEDHMIDISVSDNGKGMDSEVLSKLQANDYQIDDGSQHMGLYNVIRRLKMYFNDHVKISINSALDCGFEIVIQIQEE